MIYYRSDWPEVGLKNPINDLSSNVHHFHSPEKGSWFHERQISGVGYRFVATKNIFESHLYDYPIWYFFLEVAEPDTGLLDSHLENELLLEWLRNEIRMLIKSSPIKDAYVAAKLVKKEPLYNLLLEFGFKKVENRRLYTCRIGDLKGHDVSDFDTGIIFTRLSEIPKKHISLLHEQIIDCCRQSFSGKGYTRHFNDSFLYTRLPGIDYLLSAMRLNFESLPPDFFLVAVDKRLSKVYGFSVIGKKWGPKGEFFSQLLSAVYEENRGRGIYRGITGLIRNTLPRESMLLNITHVSNNEVQRAYKDSGRIHLTDTVVLRRVFHTSQKV